MIELKKIVFQYKKGNPILKGINYTFNEGDTYLIEGSNGSGKTTLLRLLCGLLKQNSGEVNIPTDCVISFLPDNNGIYENMTIMENIKFRISIYNLSFKDLQKEVNEFLVNYELDIHKNKLVSDLSLGMKKKVGLICALIVKPDILILDEPTGGIDSKSRKELVDIINDKKRSEVITIITSHDNNFIDLIESKKVFIKEGVLIDATSL